ncbi:LysR substrate-binding domain-containing protein [Desulfocurvibacter africanus]|uniref:Transcriptional regulator, LysR family n=1 Tax=Desulfocurvibacter africanus subsp. africanus str. Walvis Bay TaxID=690850 RepID=F3YV32_DESAF|nr:LysR substrate-binding domain-containing protein [Desulfocurvibacter africanus]EGJ49282.1 transcriptional regulator, LysR family [Desulfocurvibacter africanus subsp. africanus str. Walvis Bay]
MHLPIDLLRSFVAVADSGSFTRAGLAVNLTQSAVSQHVKRLESDLGQALFKRNGRTVSLTHEGEVLLRHARRVLRAHDEALAALIRPELSGLVRIGSHDDYAATFLPSILARFSEVYPFVQVEVHCEPSTRRLLETLDAGGLDLAVCTCAPVDAGEAIRREPLAWVTSDNHATHEQDVLPFAAYNFGCAYRRWALEALEKIGRRYRIAYSSQSLSGIFSAVSAGLAIAVAGVSTVPQGLRILGPEDGFPDLPAATLTLHRSNGGASPEVECLARFVADEFSERRAPLRGPGVIACGS